MAFAQPRRDSVKAWLKSATRDSWMFFWLWNRDDSIGNDYGMLNRVQFRVLAANAKECRVVFSLLIEGAVIGPERRFGLWKEKGWLLFLDPLRRIIHPRQRPDKWPTHRKQRAVGSAPVQSAPNRAVAESFRKSSRHLHQPMHHSRSTEAPLDVSIFPNVGSPT